MCGDTNMLPQTPSEVTAVKAILIAAKRLAWQRAANGARAYAQLQPLKLQLETSAEIYDDGHLRMGASGDFVIVQFHLDYEALKLPDCNPVPLPGFKR